MWLKRKWGSRVFLELPMVFRIKMIKKKAFEMFLEKKSFYTSQLRQYTLFVQSWSTHCYAWFSPTMNHIQTSDVDDTDSTQCSHIARGLHATIPPAYSFLWLKSCHLSSLRHVTQITCRLQNVIQIPCEYKFLIYVATCRDEYCFLLYFITTHKTRYVSSKWYSRYLIQGRLFSRISCLNVQRHSVWGPLQGLCWCCL